MKTNKILKAVAITNFFSLLILFIAYRMGTFDQHLKNITYNYLSSPNGGTQTNISNETQLRKIDSLDFQRFPSSKSVIVMPRLNLMNDTSSLFLDSIEITRNNKIIDSIFSRKPGVLVVPKNGIIKVPRNDDTIIIKSKTKIKK